MTARAAVAVFAVAALAGCSQALRLHSKWPAPPGAALAARAPTEPKTPWLELDAPGDGASLVAVVPLVEVRGRAGLGAHGPQDVVLALDSSGSVFMDSGIDLDGDGITGKMRCKLDYGSCPLSNLKIWTTDFDDILIKVEIDAAQHLVAQLDPDSTRMGLVKFGRDAWVELPVGPLPLLSQKLADFDFELAPGTDIVGALHVSIDALEQAPPLAAGAAPQRTILLLTDGEQSIVEVYGAAQEDYLNGFLARARAANTRVFAFQVGPQGELSTELMAKLARGTGGRHVPVRTAADIAVELQLVGLTGLADVELRNATTGAAGRAVRVFPNGSFDGYAPLVEGDNDLAVTATLDDGRRLESHARVHFASPAHPTAEELAVAETLARTLKERTVSTDLQIRVESERRRRARSLSISTEPAR